MHGHILQRLALLLLPLAATQMSGNHAPIAAEAGNYSCATSTTGTSGRPATWLNFAAALEQLRRQAQLGDSSLATRTRCWQKYDVWRCNTVARAGDECIDVCGQPYASMLCGDVATVAQRIVDKCPLGGIWTTPDPYQGDTFVVRAYQCGREPLVV